MLATNVVASKYFRGTTGHPGARDRRPQAGGRVVDTIARWGRRRLLRHRDRPAHLSTPSSPISSCARRPRSTRRSGSTWASRAPPVLGVLHQLGRSTRWIDPRARQDRGHALQVRHRHRLQPLQHPLSKELLAGGGTASGPGLVHEGLRRLRRGDQEAAARPAAPAKMVILNADHPDILEFITLQGRRGEEGLGADRRRLRRQLHDGEAYASVFFQNSNNSVQATDAFMKAVTEDQDWQHPRRPRRPRHGDLPGAGHVPGDLRGGLRCAVTRGCSSTPP